MSIINAPGASKTSVILVPIATFAPAAIHDALPAGPKASGVTGPFAIPNVPNGSYFVLVAWENDGLVLDPSWSISGGAAKTPEVTVAGADVVLDTFKATEALGVISPGGPDGSAPSNPLAFVWKDDSSEDHFEVRLVDSSGKTVWQKLDVPGVSGSDVSVAYTGPALASGQKFQFRATSVKGSVPMSRTEDLRGVFVAP